MTMMMTTMTKDNPIENDHGDDMDGSRCLERYDELKGEESNETT